MRVYEIALFFLAFNACASLAVNASIYTNSVFSGGDSIAADYEYIDSINISNKAPSTEESSFFGLTDATNFIGGAISGITFFTEVIWGATFGIQGTFSAALGGSAIAKQIGSTVAIGMWVLYIIGAFQFFLGRGGKGML
jgi:hypothetical protein